MAGKKPVGARAWAFETLLLIEEGAYANPALDACLEGPGRGLSREDSGLLTELVLGTVRHRLTLDWLIDQRIDKPHRLKTGPRILLRLGLYQLLWLDKIPDHAAVYETVEMAGRRYHRGVASLINAVLRGSLREKDQIRWPDEKRDPAAYLSIRHSHPLWLIERWLERYGFAASEAFCRYDNQAPRLWIRTNTLKTTRGDLAERLKAEGRGTEPGGFAPEALALSDGAGIRNLESFREGLFIVQDESSMLPAHGLTPLPGQRVLDACAAPGGKTTHIAQLMEDKGDILAWDIHPSRVKMIRENARRLGIKCIVASVRDAAEISDSGEGNMLFDRILVDAPCTGLGVLRRRADARWRREPEDIRRMAEIQEKILRRSLSLLAPGGRLLYSTCTTEPEENRLLAEKVLGAYPDCRKGKLQLPVLREENRGLLPDPAKDWDIQLLPFIHGLEGFYMAAIEKRPDAL